MPLVAVALALMFAAQDDNAPKKGDSVTPPILIQKVKAKYSQNARKKKVEGSVDLQVVVGDDGRTRDIKVLKSLDPELDENAIAAAKEYIFNPATRQGKPVAVYATVVVTFRLTDP